MSTSQVTLVTGLQGNAKTLYTIKMVKEWSEREKRPVFYHGITILNEVELPWTPIDPLQWHTAPPGAIVLIDECQDVFRPRASSQTPPDHVKALEKLRHNGINLVLITQHPMLIDNAVRRLCGRHIHAIRIFGSESSTYHEWDAVRTNCELGSARKDSRKSVWLYDKSMYGWYKSSELHTFKRKIPLRVKLLFLAPLALIAMIYLVYYLMIGKKSEVISQLPGHTPSSQVQQGTVSVQPQQREKEKWEDPLADAKRYTFESMPRVAGLTHTAPKYDGVTQPTTAPMPTSCVASKTKCTCYSQQATIMDVQDDMCRQIVERGFFIDFPLDRDKQTADRPPEDRRASAFDHPDAYLVRADSVPVVPVRTTGDHAPAASDAGGYGVVGGRRDALRQPGA